MRLIMRSIAATVVCFLCAGYVSRAQTMGKHLSSPSDRKHTKSWEVHAETRRGLADPWKAFATVLLAFNHATVRWHTAPRHVHGINNLGKSTRRQARHLMTGTEETRERPGMSPRPDSSNSQCSHWREQMDFRLPRRTVLTTLLAGGLATTAIPALRAEASSVAAAVKVFEVAKASLDPRLYRGLILANGLRVLLSSDPQLKKGAAAVDVQVGYMNDPKDLPGLAHFCEHMLFLGTKKFPNENDFPTIVASGGGSNNAYTDTEDTNYYFDVQAEMLKPVLERFAGFFAAPLFTESATSREVNAINSEHQKKRAQ